MLTLASLTNWALVGGLVPSADVTVVHVEWIGSDAVNIFYKDGQGNPASELLYRDDEPRFALTEQGRYRSFDADGGQVRLVSEAHRIQLTYLFDSLLAGHSSDIEALPHQLTAVCEELLMRQPLRFLLANDPGAGKTIVPGL